MKLSKPIGDSPHFKSFQICQQFANSAWVMPAWVSTMCMMRSMRSMCTRPLPLNRNLQLSSFTTTSEGVFTEEVQSSCKAIHSGETLKLHQHGRSLRGQQYAQIQANCKILEKSVRVDITPVTHSSAHICTSTYSLTVCFHTLTDDTVLQPLNTHTQLSI